jgi:hypothetical protein
VGCANTITLQIGSFERGTSLCTPRVAAAIMLALAAFAALAAVAVFRQGDLTAT